MTKSTRERIKAKKRRERARSLVIAGGIAVLAIAGVVWLATQSRERSSGEDVPIPEAEVVPQMPEITHIAQGTDPGPYNSDPPTSGRHYDTQAFAGLYTEADLESFGEFPEGYLVHSLEHGYVIFWYNCTDLNEAECEELKEDIDRVHGRVGDFKVIGFPWTSIEEPVVLTSWGRMLRFEEFDPDQAEQYVKNFRNQAPEPQAP